MAITIVTLTNLWPPFTPASIEGVVVAKGWYPCCCPSISCKIGEDSFARESIGDDWSQDSGTWTISSEVLETEDADARLEYQTPHPDLIGSHIVTVKVKASANNDAVRIWLATDLFVELVLTTDGSGYLRLIDGSTTLIELSVSDAVLDEWHVLSGCYHYGEEGIPKRFIGSFTSYEEDTYVLEAYSSTVPVLDSIATAPYVGLATGDLTGVASFDDFTFYKHLASDAAICDECERVMKTCSLCVDSESPQAVSVTFSGVEGTCADCPDLNGTWILAATEYDCNYENIISWTCSGSSCTGAGVFATILEKSSTYRWQVSLRLYCNNNWDDTSLGDGINRLAVWEWDSGAATLLDCFSDRSLDLIESKDTYCDTVSITDPIDLEIQ